MSKFSTSLYSSGGIALIPVKLLCFVANMVGGLGHCSFFSPALCLPLTKILVLVSPKTSFLFIDLLRELTELNIHLHTWLRLTTVKSCKTRSSR